MINGVSGVSSLQLLRATEAFKNAVKSSLSVTGENIDEVKLSLSQEGQKIANELKKGSDKVQEASLPKNNQKVNEIKEFASKYASVELSDEDINYAIRYGRSILVDKAG